MAYVLRTDIPWSQTYEQMENEFRLWGVRDFEVRSPGRNDRRAYQDVETRRVRLSWTARGGQEMRLEMSDQDRAVDNLRVLYLAISAMRLNEVRGIGKVLEQAYAQLAAPKGKRSPYEVLNIQPSAPLEVAEASYRALAKLMHPDAAGGSSEAMAELNDAIEQLRKGQTPL